jgi:4-hydroxy-2-oxoheptanedioate aldolase
MTLPVPSLPGLLPAGPARFLGWSCIADPAIAGALARSGFDAVLLDQQHGAHDYHSSCAAITEVALAGKPSLVRVPVGDFAMASRMLDAGASGIVAPMINSIADAQALVAATKYPPVGQRSWGPDRAMWMSGLGDASEYLAGANAHALTIAMCETAEAIDALESILALPGIDGILVGPADLSIALSKGRSLIRPARPSRRLWARSSARPGRPASCPAPSHRRRCGPGRWSPWASSWSRWSTTR